MKVPRLDLRRVSFVVNGKRILSDVSWVVGPEEHWAILGPNGAGKTTLLKIVCGYVWPNAGGEIYRNGEAHVNLGDLRRSIGWVTSTLVDEVPKRETVLDTVISGKYAQMGLWRFSWEPATAADTERARRYLREMGCEGLARRRFGTLSQGEQQKVLICRARMTKPYLTILDEPCAGMDPGAREVFLSSLRSIGQNVNHPSFIYVTHHVEEILPIFTKTLILKNGKVMKSGNTDDVLSDRTISELYDISVQLVKKNGRYWPIPA
ncbi:MAG TPA: ABC transporter ATP-binding protein [Syntrophorhabdales bacterium]|nr:ABC transporter ATP-binding protein [Syntrophorhabdales bacterium]